MKKMISVLSLMLGLFASVGIVSCGGDSDGGGETPYFPKDGERIFDHDNSDYAGTYVFYNGGKELKLTAIGQYYSLIPQNVEFKGKKYPVTCIGKEACAHSSSLGEIIIPSGVTIIEDGAFKFCKSYSLSMPNSLKSIGESAFSNIEWLDEISIPDGITTIEALTFSGCKNLGKVSIPNSVKEIKEYAFEYCGFSSFTIPGGVGNIEQGVLWHCDNLKSVTSNIQEPFAISSVFDINFINSGTLYVPKGTVEKYKATDGWKDIKNIVEQ